MPPDSVSVVALFLCVSLRNLCVCLCSLCVSLHPIKRDVYFVKRALQRDYAESLCLSVHHLCVCVRHICVCLCVISASVSESLCLLSVCCVPCVPVVYTLLGSVLQLQTRVCVAFADSFLCYICRQGSAFHLQTRLHFQTRVCVVVAGKGLCCSCRQGFV